ncbi:MAG: hypothetical protein EA385_10570 [Salinarimonadaceae bacterium]|nr:MAG: hypothetical protein EA385_10570 [Salinarimonadaceae bacterium]
MKISEVVAVPVSVPLTTPYHISRGIMTHFPSVIVRITTDDGLTGFGESVPLSVVGDVVPLAERINTTVRDVLMGRDPFDIEAHVAAILSALDHDLDTLGGVDIALWDLAGKALNTPVFNLMGGRCNDPILVDYTMGAQSPAQMADRAAEICATGYRGLVVKVTGDVAQDVERVRAVKERVAADITVRVDCNGGYSRDDARRFLEAVKPLGLEFVEQPVVGDDLAGLRLCREIGVPISVDESLNTLGEALALISEQACDVFNIKIPKVGGLTLAKKIAAVGEAAGMPIVVGGRTTLELSRHASRHFAASTPGTRGRAHEGPGPASQALSDDVVAVRSTLESVGAQGSTISVETAAGLGATVIWDKVEHFRLS